MSTWTNILDLVYPVGAVYTSKAATSPATLFGGTWTQLKEKFIFAAGTTYKVGATGGAATVTLTTDQMPSHVHSFSNGLTTSVIINSIGNPGEVNWQHNSGSAQLGAGSMDATGGGESHNNMPPYQVFYVWYRTA